MNAAVHLLISYWVKHRLLRTGDRGATAVEYALLAALIAGVIFLSVTAFGAAVGDLFQSGSDGLAAIPIP